MQGHVLTRGTTFSTVIDLPPGADGKHRQKWTSGFATRKQAQLAVAQLVARSAWPAATSGVGNRATDGPCLARGEDLPPLAPARQLKEVRDLALGVHRCCASESR